MDPNRWRRICEIFDAVLTMAAAERSAFIDRSCGSDRDLRCQIERLLSCSARADEEGFLESPLIKLRHRSHLPELQPGRVVGNYTIVGKYAEGGMGVVYKATQARPQRSVAFKVTRIPQAIARKTSIVKEAEFLGQLESDRIAKIYEAGIFESGGERLSFIAMEFVKGNRLTDYASTRARSVTKKLKLLLQVCEGVQHAHGRGVLHLDLKPENILVTKRGHVKILDFGLARVIDPDSRLAALLPHASSRLGTLPYMAPEQAGASETPPSVATDVYALGVICYQLVRGALPFDLNDMTTSQVIRTIATVKPSPVTSSTRHPDAELDAIVKKAMSKSPDDRYPTVESFARDIKRRLADEPVEAIHRSSPGYRTRKYIRRHRGAVLAITTVLLSLVVGLIGTVVKMREAQAYAARATSESRRSARHLYSAQSRLAFQACINTDTTMAWKTLDAMHPMSLGMDLRSFEWFYIWKSCHAERYTLPGHRFALSVSPDGSLLASIGGPPRPLSARRVTIWNIAEQRIVQVLNRLPHMALCLKFSPDGRYLVIGCANGEVVVYDWASGNQAAAFGRYAGAVRSVLFTPDGSNIAIGAGDSRAPTRIILWDWRTGSWRCLSDSYTDGVCALAFSSDGEHILCASRESMISVIDMWSATSSQRVLRITYPELIPDAMAFSKSRRLVASADVSADIHLHSVDTGVERAVLHGHTQAVASLGFSPDDRLLFSCGHDKTVRIWDVESGQQIHCLLSHVKAVTDAAWVPGTTLLASCGDDSSVKVWDYQRASMRVIDPKRGISGLALSAKGDFVALALHKQGDPHRFIIHVTMRPRTVPLSERSGPALPMSTARRIRETVEHYRVTVRNYVSENGYDEYLPLLGSSLRGWINGGGVEMGISALHSLARRASSGPEIHLYNAASGELSSTLKGIGVLGLTLTPGHQSAIRALALSEDQSVLASGDQSGSVFLWSLTGRRDRHEIRATGGAVEALTFSPDGSTLVAATSPRLRGPASIHVWETESLRRWATMRCDDSAVAKVAFLGKTKRLMTAGENGVLRIWNLDTTKCISTFRTKVDSLGDVDVSSDGTKCAVSDGERSVRGIGEVVVYSTGTWREIRVLRGHRSHVAKVAFHPDGRLLASGGEDGCIFLWDVETGQIRLELPSHPGRISGLAFSADGSVLAISSSDGICRVHIAATEEEVSEYDRLLTMTLDEDRYLSGPRNQPSQPSLRRDRR